MRNQVLAREAPPGPRIPWKKVWAVVGTDLSDPTEEADWRKLLGVPATASLRSPIIRADSDADTMTKAYCTCSNAKRWSLPKRGLPIFNRDAVLLEVREEWQRRGRLDLDTEGIGQRLGYLVVLWPEAFLEFVLLQQKLLPCAFACKSQSAIRLACARAAHAASEVIGAIAVDCAGSSRRLHP